MPDYVHQILQFLMSVFNWITKSVNTMVITVIILFAICVLFFIIRILPYRKYPKNIKVILPKEIIQSIRNFFVSILMLVILCVATNVFVKIDEYLEKIQKLQELQTVYKNINKDYLLADVTVIDINSDSTLTLDISYYSYGDNQKSIFTEPVTIKGSTVYIDCNQYNFEYSSIETGENKNLALPYRIFSNTVSANNGIELNPYNKDGVPYIFERTKDTVWGIDPEVYTKRVKELVKIMNDPQKSKLDGILRSTSGSAIHFVAQKGVTYRIYVSQSGGLTLTKKTGWY
ncbi:MAG: hypothetical protein BKP49_06990 [Treponema sp. CETP13]|nr:MAG: hypothetical protein BKP49_06990 [Treponema sp. CETP13]